MKFLLWLSVFILFGTVHVSNSQEKINEKSQEVLVTPDEFSDLDAIPLPKSTNNEKILPVLEKSRQRYLQALIMLERRDTSNSFGYFEESLKLLNSIADEPEISKNSDFIDLLDKIADDYSEILQDRPKLINASLLLPLTNRFINKNEKSLTSTKLESLKFKVDNSSASNPFKNENIIPLDDNEFVQKSIEFLTQNKVGKKFLKNCLERYGKWGPMLSKIIAEEGMPQEIIFLSMVESGLNPHAVSRSKAVGLWQFMKVTGMDYGLNSTGSVWLDERRDPVKSTRASMKHLKDLYNTFGDWYLAMAAYNYGAGGVRKSIKRSKLENPNYWDLRDFLPKETKNYVPLFIATAKVATNPKDYGIDLSDYLLQEEFIYDTFTLNESVSLKALAKCSGISMDEFKDLNPELILTCTPPDAKEYTVRIPKGSKTSFITSLAILTPEEKQPWVTHLVRKKETFNSIADIYGVPAEALASANGMSYTNKHLKRGIELRVPTESIIRTEEISDTTDEQKTGDTLESDDLTTFITHTVENGETLAQIANQYSINLGDIKNLNGISDDNAELIAGSILKIAPKNDKENIKPTLSIAHPDVIKHTVKENETIESIAEHYQIQPEDIRRWNRIEGSVRLGQNIKIITSAVYTPSQLIKKTTRRNEFPKKDSDLISKNAQISKDEISSEPAEKIQHEKAKKIKHKVRKGENLSSIADKYSITIDDLKKWNPKEIKGSKIRTGSVLKVYSQSNYSNSGNTKNKKTVVTKNKKEKSKTSKSYTVKRGDNLQSISSRTGISIKNLRKYNKNINNKDLKAGQKLKLR